MIVAVIRESAAFSQTPRPMVTVRAARDGVNRSRQEAVCDSFIRFDNQVVAKLGLCLDRRPIFGNAVIVKMGGAGLYASSDLVLLTLKTEGPQTAKDLADRLDVSRQAARQQLERLRSEGLVAYVAEKGKVGRPSFVWTLSAAGHATFPDGHADALTALIAAIRSKLGEAALDALIDHRQAETAKAYRLAMAECADLVGRTAKLAELRTTEGYMAHSAEEPDGSILLVENHCPICAAASRCQGFCRAELDMFRDLLGEGAEVERAEHLLAGARRCAYRIRPLRPG